MLFFGLILAEFESMFQEAIERMESLGGTRVEIDFTPFSDIAGLLYGGAFVTERLSGLRNFLQNSVESPLTKEGILSDKRLLPVIAKIFSGGGGACMLEPPILIQSCKYPEPRDRSQEINGSRS